MRSDRVSMPCEMRKALNGDAAGPRSRSSWTRALRMKARLAPEGAADAEVTAVDEAVVAVVGGVVVGELLGVGGVVEGARVDDGARDRGAVAAEVLRRRVHDDVGAPLDGTDEVGRGDGVVDDERHAVLVGEGRDGLDVEHLALGVGDGLAEEELGLGPDRLAPRVDRGRVVDEGDLDAEARQGVLQQVVGAAVERGGGDDVVAGLGDVEDRERLGRLAGGDEQRPDATLERGDALLDDVGRGVHQAGVDVAELAQPEEVGRVVGAREDVARRLVDRQRPGAGGGVGRLARVDLLGLEGPVRGAWGCRRSWHSLPLALAGDGRPAARSSPGAPHREGGLPASEPGLVADTHDLRRGYERRGGGG